MPPYGWILLICAAIFIAAVALYLFLIKPASTRGMDLAKYGTKFAHRGLWDAQSPENSLSAFQKAVDAGYGIEFDIHKTKDGQVVVFHDDTLMRMCGVEGKVEDKTLAELRRLRLGGTDEKIPLLSEMKDKENRKAKFVSAVAFYNGEEGFTVVGECPGFISHSPKGENGFGYDPVFVPEGYNESYAQISSLEKNTISHRARALVKFKEKITQYLEVE